MNSRGKSYEVVSESERQGAQRISTFDKLVSKLPERTKDNFLLLLLFVMGLSGFAYIMTVPFGNATNQSSLFDKIFNPTQRKSITSNFIKSNLLKIGGDLKSNSELQFNFQGLSEEHDYEINFGDKLSVPIDNQQLMHSYQTPGTYKVELKKLCSGHTYIVHCEYINIE